MIILIIQLHTIDILIMSIPDPMTTTTCIQDMLVITITLLGAPTTADPTEAFTITTM